ncbi:hypothetical protein H4C80_17065 [Pseudomonas juntendi]|uniref:Uncharacterized protein n=1 Tax=Pseudomonas juntendi TaxID=2666183 RepID=A0A7W2KHX2_9PSED|nr:hypothetical protein [Pseudomonas juntendi]MBA6098828.1 hypothetical protein [Pseudomonas juntendi]
MDDDSESCFFIGSQTFAVRNYGNSTRVCQIRFFRSAAETVGADYPESFRKTEHLFLRLFGFSNGTLSPHWHSWVAPGCAAPAPTCTAAVVSGLLRTALQHKAVPAPLRAQAGMKDALQAARFKNHLIWKRAQER